jgi:hypothetical protein
VVKTFDLQKRPHARNSIRRESLIHRKLTDPHIVKYYGHHHEGNFEYIFLEYAVGDLFDRIGEYPSQSAFKRTILKLEEYDFTIHYRSGKTISHADFLSRIHKADVGESGVNEGGSKGQEMTESSNSKKKKRQSGPKILDTLANLRNLKKKEYYKRISLVANRWAYGNLENLRAVETLRKLAKFAKGHRKLCKALCVVPEE